METALTVVEATELKQHESVIDRGLKTFAEVGNALLAIRDGRLYRQSHGTFEEYCKERWGMSRPRAYQLIDSAAVIENLSTMVDKPTTERQARPLTKLPPADQPEAWERAVGIRIRAERRLGEMIRHQKETVGLNTGTLLRGTTEEPRDNRPTLAQAGIDKRAATRHQRNAGGGRRPRRWQRAA